MPFIVNKNSTDYYLVPAPLVSFTETKFNNQGRPGFGAEYSVTLEGNLLPTHGNPYYTNSGNAGLSTANWVSTSIVEDAEVQSIDADNLLDGHIKKQEQIRWLFTNPVISGVAQPIKIHIKPWDASSSGLYFQAFVDSVVFDSQGRWANPGTYTVNLRNATFLSSSNNGLFLDNNDLTNSTYKVTSITQSFDVSEDSQKTLIFNNNFDLQHTNKVYTINRSVSIGGAPVYDTNGAYVSGLSPWQQASGYMYEYLGLGTNALPSLRSSLSSLLGSSYNIANTVYTESINEEDGTYTVSETYLAYSGAYPVIETININEDTDESDKRSISVQGSIQGLNTVNGFSVSGNAYNNAKSYWDTISTGTPPDAYNYALGMTGASWLHPKALTTSVGRDPSNGIITYNYNFDDRPPNLIPGSVSESITINDTYPGEIISETPVIGRSQPILQYLNSRSGYKRTLSINVVMGPANRNWNTTLGTDVNNSGTLISGSSQSIVQGWLISQKPSITNSGEFNTIYQAANPVNDPNFSVLNGKCYHSAPQESWDARTRQYTYNIEWTYTRLE